MRVLLGLLLVGFLSFCAWGETSSPLTWQDCVRAAAQHNPDLLSSYYAVDASRAQYRSSFNGVLPNLSLSNSYADGSTRAGGSAAGNSVASGANNWQAAGTASLSLFNLAQWASLQNASAGLGQAQANLRATSSNTLLNLYDAFSGLLFAQEDIQVAQAIKGIWATNADMITLRYKSGQESKGNMMRTNAQFVQAELALDQAYRDLRAAQQALNQAIGQDAFTVVVVTGTLTADPLPLHPPDLDRLVDKHPKVLLQQAALAQARAGLQTAHSVLWPTLSANYTKGWQGSSELPSDPSWIATGILSYPVFGGGPTAAYYGVASARRTVDKAQEDLRSVRNQVRSRIESAWSAYAQAVDQVAIQKVFLDAAIQRKGEADIQYQSGLLLFVNWEQIVSDLVNFERSYLKARETAVQNEAQWKNSVGEGLGGTHE